MKRLLSILLSAVLLIGGVSANVSAEEEIIGLDENLDELLMKNYFTDEELAEIDRVYTEAYSEHALNTIIPGRQQMNKMQKSSVEEEYALIMEKGILDYDSALRVSNLSNFKYSDQYAQLGHIEYLFDGKEYWNIILEENGLANGYSRFKLNGERIENIEEYLGYFNDPIKQRRAYDLIEEKNTIKKLLLENGEKEVEDVKIFALRRTITAMYVKCPEQEYIIKVYQYFVGEPTVIYEGYYEFMTAKEFAQEYEQYRRSRSESYVTPAKFTYDMEAETLQEEGLLLGTEKGLELLKPLTRAEAATILLRAMGESTEAKDASLQTFSDVSPDYWGYGAVENSYKLGIMKGIGDNLFAPEDIVTAAQFSTMVLRASGTYDFDWETALNLLIEKGVISETDASTMDFFARCDMAKIIYEAKARNLF